MVGSLVFASAFAVACAVIVAMIAPQWRRILSLATGHPERAFAPLATLAVAERRITVRRWSARPAPVGSPRLNDAA